MTKRIRLQKGLTQGWFDFLYEDSFNLRAEKIDGFSQKIGNYTTLANNVELGYNVEIGDNCYIGEGVKIMADCVIGNSVWIDRGSIILEGVKIHSKSRIHENVKIDRNTIVGESCTLKHNVKIGHACRIGAGAFIFNRIVIGNGAVIQDGTLLANGLFIADQYLDGLSYVGNGEICLIEETHSIEYFKQNLNAILSKRLFKISIDANNMPNQFIKEYTEKRAKELMGLILTAEQFYKSIQP